MATNTNLTNIVHGTLTAIRLSATKTGGGRMWEVKCACGKTLFMLAKSFNHQASHRGCILKRKQIQPALECHNGCGKPGAIYSKFSTGKFCSAYCAHSYSTKTCQLRRRAAQEQSKPVESKQVKGPKAPDNATHKVIRNLEIMGTLVHAGTYIIKRNDAYYATGRTRDGKPATAETRLRVGTLGLNGLTAAEWLEVITHE